MPFIICTANGERKDLFGRFNSFIADKDSGNIETSIIYTSSFLKTGLFNVSLLSNILIENLQLKNISDDLLTNLLNITPNDAEVISGINNSIEHIKSGLLLPELINYSADELFTLHKRHSSWRTFHALPSSIMVTLGGVIPVDFLISEKSLSWAFAMAI